MMVVCVECGATIHVGVYDSSSTDENGVSHGLCSTCLARHLQLLKEKKERRKREDNKE